MTAVDRSGAASAQATAFHEEFTAALARTGSAYAAAESTNAGAMSGALDGTTIGLIMDGSGWPIPPPSYV